MRSNKASGNRLAARAALGAMLALLLLSACSDAKSYLLIRMTLKEGSAPITGFGSARVSVAAAGLTDELVYPARTAPNNSLTATRAVSFSVSFSDALNGNAQLSVELVSPTGSPMGYGMTTLLISPGRVAYATVIIDPAATRPTGDGGVPDTRPPTDGPLDDTRANFACTPSSMAGCGANQTCAVSCLATSGEPQSLCKPAGTKQPGELCQGEGECAPGSQCFKDSCSGSTVRVCRRHCSTDADCPATGRCFTEIKCDTPPRPTGVRICSQPCDPRGQAKTGCAEGLRCFIYDGEVPDCDCVSDQRVKGEGEACAAMNNCLPGFLCVRAAQAATSVCRAICRLDGPNTCAPGFTCKPLVNPSYQVFGACEP